MLGLATFDLTTVFIVPRAHCEGSLCWVQYRVCATAWSSHTQDQWHHIQ